MSTATDTRAQAGGTVAEGTGLGLLDQAIRATRQTEPDRAAELLRALTEEATKGTVVYSKSLTQTLTRAIKLIDEQISAQLNAVMHHPDFQKLEGSWRGLHHLVMKSETSTSLKLKLLNVGKKELAKDLGKAAEFDQSLTYKAIYENEFGTPGGEPYGALIGDYEFSNHPEDVALLTGMSQVAAAGFAPFIAAAGPKLFGFDDFTGLPKSRDLAKIFDTVEYASWRSFRESEDSRFVTLVMPRTLARLPYGSNTAQVEQFDYEEAPLGPDGKSQPMRHDDFCWMNAAYVLGARLTAAFAQHSWCTAIRGEAGGGKVEGLPSYTFISDDGDTDQKCPTEVAITDRREQELSRLGFLPLSHYKDTDYAVFFGSQTCQKPARYDRPEAQANAEISARLPYIMATSRFAHYLKVMARDMIGAFKERDDIEKDLNRWILNYVNGDPTAGQESKAKYPLAEAMVEVREVPGSPGSYNAIAHLRPWLQMEELTTSLRMVARIPKRGG